MRVNDTPNRRSVYDAAIAASPDGQHLTVIFYDKRNDPGQGYFVDLYLAESFDGGQTWQPNQRITESSSDLRKAPLTADGYMLGDYQGVAPALDFQTPAVACWIDTRSGNPDCYIRRLDRKRGTTFGAWQHLRFTTKELADDTVSGPNADLDGDGIPNLGEYIHGLEPRHADPNPSRVKQTFCSDPTKGPDCPAALQVAFESLSVLEDITFSWSRSENLVSWEQVSPAIEQVIPSPSRTFVTREASFLVNPAQPLEAFQLRKQQK